jgi:hypothetical protein
MTFLAQRQVDRYMFDLGPRRMFPFQDFLDDAKNGTLAQLLLHRAHFHG